MKVLCIESNPDKDACSAPGLEVVEGEIYTVRREHEFSMNKHNVIEHYPVYELYERPEGWGYAKDRFIPVSDINEKEFEKNYNYQTLTI